MVRHSKNNTASASFTKAEYGMMNSRWGSKKIKLGAESFKQFDQCSLCLNQVDTPVLCNEGHLFCKECIYSSLLDQKKEIALVKATLHNLEREHQAQRDTARAEAMERVQKDFERVQSGVGRDRRENGDRSSNRRDRSRSPVSSSNSSSLVDLPARIKAQTERAIEEAMNQLRMEQMQAKKDKIPAYWLPSLTPAAETKVEDIVKRTEDLLERGLETKCYVGDQFGHPVSIKSLIDVHFISEAVSGEGAKRYICPSCKKGMSSVSKLFAIRSCGHIHCSDCVDTLLRPAFKKAQLDKAERPSCLECGKTMKSESKDLITIQREGTGFTSAGGNETKKKGIAFQG